MQPYYSYFTNIHANTHTHTQIYIYTIFSPLLPHETHTHRPSKQMFSLPWDPVLALMPCHCFSPLVGNTGWISLQILWLKKRNAIFRVERAGLGGFHVYLLGLLAECERCTNEARKDRKIGVNYTAWEPQSLHVSIMSSILKS